MEPNKVYKPLVRTYDGRLLSIWAGEMTGVTLEYKEGKVTHSPEGGAGIWICQSLELAQEQRSNKRLKGVFVVHEAVALGERCGEMLLPGGLVRSIFSGDTRYPAILLGKEVWRESVRPEPRFKVGDKVIILRDKYHTGIARDIGIITVSSVTWRENHYSYRFEDSAYTAAEEWLELAPEWADVTRECTFEPHLIDWGMLVKVLHLGAPRLWMGCSGVTHPVKPDTPETKDYKLEPAERKTIDGAQYFRILKRS